MTESHSSHETMIQSQKKLVVTIILVSFILTAKFIGAYTTKSLALLSDSWHLATDLISLIISWWGIRSSLKPASTKYSYGYCRYSVFTALINNVSLILISIYILYQAILRYFHPVEIAPRGMILLSVLGLMINLAIIRNLGNHSKNANVKSVFLHFMGDALSDVGVLLGGVIILLTGQHGVDTLLSAALACLILKNALRMCYECTKILLEAVPRDISIEELRDALKEIQEIVDVKDIHVWSLSMETLAMTAHICIHEANMSLYETTLHKVQHMLKEQFGIEHSAIQIENLPCSSCYHSKPDHSLGCNLCVDCTRVSTDVQKKRC
ncbi:cation transporter [Anoxybacterium hadale]|uniref:Cation transporter n=1 Tax=Anoxybacterium hadale TaxID=3408580 RepID=A0ACD1AEW4_9FIRM|nr:cation transporter [Clostridiales bacterium]